MPAASAVRMASADGAETARMKEDPIAAGLLDHLDRDLVGAPPPPPVVPSRSRLARVRRPACRAALWRPTSLARVSYDPPCPAHRSPLHEPALGFGHGAAGLGEDAHGAGNVSPRRASARPVRPARTSRIASSIDSMARHSPQAHLAGQPPASAPRKRRLAVSFR